MGCSCLRLIVLKRGCHDVTLPIALAGVQDGYPCLWGAIATTPAVPLVAARHAKLLPTRRTGLGGQERWWEGKFQGALDATNQPIAACTDLRGDRPIYPLSPDHRSSFSSSDRVTDDLKKERELVLYGGSIYDHFGHLVLDLTRLYQLLPLFRKSKATFWFHYPALQGMAEIAHPLVLEWLECLGLQDRVALIQREVHCNHLITAEVLYRDRGFVSVDFPVAARQALSPQLRQRLLARTQKNRRIAYLSRHHLGQGTTRFEGEQEVVEALQSCANVDVIQPEMLSIEAKLNLYRDYSMVTGFAQACMNMKYFAPYSQAGEIAPQLMFISGPRSLSSNWVNLDRAAGFGDQVLDCSVSDPADVVQQQDEPVEGFQRSTRFNAGLLIDTLRSLDRC